MWKQLGSIMLNLYLISSDNHLKKHAKLNVLFRTYQYGRRTNKDNVVLFFQIRLIGRFLGGEFELKRKLKTFSGEEIHKVEKVEGDQTEEEDKEKAEDEGWGADDHIHFRFL